MDTAGHGHAVPPRRRQASLALGPPPEFAQVGEHDAQLFVLLAILRLLLLQRLDERHERALVDAAAAADHAVRENAGFLAWLAKEEDDAFGLGESRRDANGNVGFGWRSAEGQAEGLEA